MEESLSALLDHGSDALPLGEADDLPTLIYAFAGRLQATREDPIYVTLAATLHHPLAPPPARITVLTLLGWTATPQAAQALADYLLSRDVQDEVRGILRNSLQEVAYSANADARREVASILARTWEQLDADVPVADQAVVAEGIAYLSTAEGAQTLLSTLSADYRGDDQRRVIAATALGQLQHNEAVPVLASVLQDGERDAKTTWAAITGLVSINSADAYSVVMEDLGRTGVWDGHGLERLQQILSEQDISDGAIRVIRHALERQMFQDTRVTALLAEVLARHALREADDTD